VTLVLGDLAVPIVGAPMAGGPGTPALAAAASNAGGLGFLAAGYLRPEQLADDIVATRAATGGPIGVNLFVPQPSVADSEQLEAYRRRLEPYAVRYGVQVGQPRPDDDGWNQKLDVVAELRPDVVSFTFGCPEPATLARLAAIGIITLVTVTCSAEARAAVDAGAQGLIAQGPRSGGHRGTFDPAAKPAAQPLDELLAHIACTHQVPVLAAGGLATADDVAAALRLGAAAAQIGTALLLTDEAGTNPAHRSALQDPKFTSTVVTRAFSGRYARGLLNDFASEFSADAPLGYPDVNQMTAPIRKAAVAARDPQGTNMWAGTAYRLARTGGAAAIVAELGSAAN
jgi:nitronate monooxygenase